MMDNEVILYIAASQDGYIADKDGKLDFLSDIPEEGHDFGYKAMYESVDAIIMGWTTYDYIAGYFEGRSWPYTDKRFSCAELARSCRKLPPYRRRTRSDLAWGG